jgi:hypothetical protein
MTAKDPMELAASLRNAAAALRVRSMPLAQFIPLLHRAADMLERLNDPTGVLTAEPTDKEGKPVCRACGMGEADRKRYANGCPMNYPELTCPQWASWRGGK